MAFELDFRAAPTVASVLQKIPDIKLMENEMCIQNFSKALETMEEFKMKGRAMALNISDFLLPTGQIAAFTI